MKTVFKSSFEKDLRKINKKSILIQIRELIDSIENANSIHDISNIKKIKKSQNYYRVSISDFRVGLKIESGTVTFIRALHRKDIYKYFPD